MKNKISFTCKLNSFSYEWLCTKPHFDGEVKVNSDINMPNPGDTDLGQVVQTQYD